ncbi:MAG TPA: hypothetical protein VLV83_24855 [Acidobacteriota bacterium]|nr:hypothetical protein [Acidobacteriota bacterium]
MATTQEFIVVQPLRKFRGKARSAGETITDDPSSRQIQNLLREKRIIWPPGAEPRSKPLRLREDIFPPPGAKPPTEEDEPVAEAPEPEPKDEAPPEAAPPPAVEKETSEAGESEAAEQPDSDEEVTFDYPQEDDGTLKPLSRWLKADNEALLTLAGLDAKGKADDLKQRVAEYAETEEGAALLDSLREAAESLQED